MLATLATPGSRRSLDAVPPGVARCAATAITNAPRLAAYRGGGRRLRRHRFVAIDDRALQERGATSACKYSASRSASPTAPPSARRLLIPRTSAYVWPASPASPTPARASARLADEGRRRPRRGRSDRAVAALKTKDATPPTTPPRAAGRTGADDADDDQAGTRVQGRLSPSRRTVAGERRAPGGRPRAGRARLRADADREPQPDVAGSPLDGLLAVGGTRAPRTAAPSSAAAWGRRWRRRRGARPLAGAAGRAAADGRAARVRCAATRGRPPPLCYVPGPTPDIPMPPRRDPWVLCGRAPLSRFSAAENLGSPLGLRPK